MSLGVTSKRLQIYCTIYTRVTVVSRGGALWSGPKPGALICQLT